MMNQTRSLICALMALWLLPLAQAKPPKKNSPPPAPAAPISAGESLTKRLNSVLSAPALRNASVGVLVRSLDRNGRTIYARNPDLALVPASNMKLLTAAGALGVLGPEYTFKTSVARMDDESVALIGSGDPSLESDRLDDLARAVKESGMRRVSRIVADASCFDETPLGEGWQWDDESFDFSAQVSGLNLDGNTTTITVTPGSELGETASIAADTYVRILGEVRTGTGNDVRVERLRGRNDIRLKGTIRRGASPLKLTVTVEAPALYTAHRFVQALRSAGVSVPDGVVLVEEKAPAGAQTLGETNSAPLRELLKTFLKRSDNLYGECLLKSIGAAKGSGTSEGGARSIKKYLASKKLTLDGLEQADGSGLSRMNEVTPRLLVETLTLMEKTPALVTALPIGGFDGTLRGRFKGTAAEGNVRAKTGTLLGVSSLSGYITTKQGERLAFSIVMNHYDRAGAASAVRAAQDAIVLALMDTPRVTALK